MFLTSYLSSICGLIASTGLPLCSKNNKRLSKTQKRNLERALHYKYCDCIKLVRYTQKNPAAYGICAKSIYMNRDLEMPKRAAQNCSKYKKNLNSRKKSRKKR